MDRFDHAVFINCPFDKDYAPLLEAATFRVVYFGFRPRLANERLESGENRLDKIIEMIRGAKYSIHDLSRCRSSGANEFFRMNMPFEFGLDMAFRRSGLREFAQKKFLIFEGEPYDLKRSLSDVAGQDVEFHRSDFEQIIKKVRDFFRVEVGIKAPGPAQLVADYATFQGWMTEQKIYEGHSEKEALNLPTKERIDAMIEWMNAGRPATFKHPE